MPRFGLSSGGMSSPPFMSSPPPVMSPNFGSPQPSSFGSPQPMGMGSALVPFPGGYAKNRESVRLCCTSGDGQSIFSLCFRSREGFRLERRTLPLHNEANELNPPQQARLPQMVQDALDLNPPVELLYVGGDSPKPFSKHNSAGRSFPPALLCVYSRKYVFYLEMKMDSRGEIIVDATVAYESFFLNADEALTVIRIRPAPQRREDFATFCPHGAMAMLTHNAYSNEYSLVLQHNNEDDLVSMPLRFYLEESSEMSEDITDFCFAQSDGLALFSTLSVLLLKGSGEVHAASPILFDGSVIHKAALAEALDFLDYQLERFNDQKSDPKFKQCRAAKQFLQDAFGDNGQQGNFLTASVISNARIHSAVTWPVKLQGPLLPPSHGSIPGAGLAVSIENFSSSDLIGVAVGGEGHAVDLVIVTPSCLLPRFTFESEEDGYAIDDKLMRSAATVQRLILSEGEPTGMPITNQTLALVRDPLMDSLLHYVTTKAVTTVNTTAMRHALRKLQGNSSSTDGQKNVKPKTTAWTIMNVSSGTVQGAVVGTDPRFGHGLFVSISDGSLVPVNVTESSYLHEMEHFINPDIASSEKSVPPSHNIADTSVKRMEELQPLYEVVEPMIKKVSVGLGGMGKIVGSQTASKDITPDQLAVALSVKERCDKEVVLPLLELKRTVLARREIVKNMYKEQKKQITALKTTLGTIYERMTALKAKAVQAQETAKLQSERGQTVLQASQDLQPTLTQAEFDFFNQLKHQSIQLQKFEEHCKQLMEETGALRKKIQEGEIVCKFELDETNIKNAEQLLDGEEKLIAIIEATLNSSEQTAAQIFQESGVPAPPSAQ